MYSCSIALIDRLPADVSARPSIGNGFLATVVHSKEVYMMGLYNGLSSQSHRAVLPSTVSHVVASTEPAVELKRSYQLHLGEGNISTLSSV